MRAKGGAGPARHLFVLRVDAKDIIVHVNNHWLAFGKENNYPATGLIGNPLFKFVTDTTTQQLYRTLMRRALESHKTITVPFRCDTPSQRRFMSMQVVPLPGKEIEFRSRIVRTEPRSGVRFLDPAAPRGDKLIRMCGWCRKVAIPEWVEVEIGVRKMRWFEQSLLPKITHGICPACEQLMMAEVGSSLPRRPN